MLHFDGTFYRRYHTYELHQESVAGDSNNAAAMLSYFRLDKFAKVCLPLGERALLICTDKPAVTSHIGRENGHEPSVHSLADHIAAHTRLSARSLRPGAPWCLSRGIVWIVSFTSFQARSRHDRFTPMNGHIQR